MPVARYSMHIRKEETKDHREVFGLIENAFKGEAYADHKEQYLVERLRSTDSFIPELSLVAEVEGRIVGYILLTKIEIVNQETAATCLALAPVAVLKTHQGKGIGSQLIRKAHEQAKALGFGVVVLLGHETYYPRFGYKMAKDYEVRLPFDVPDENCMLIELTEGALAGVSGIVVYPKEFFE